jgi:D-serine deaminase-like pyridoxal phosphate-dependent protein
MWRPCWNAGGPARRTEIAVVADNAEVVAGLGRAGQKAGRAMSVLVECDTGAKRNGVQSPQAAAELARTVDGTKGLSFGGLMTYARPGTRIQADEFFVAARDLAARSGLDCKVITTGGSPDMWKDDGLSHITEYRAGTYIYFDRSLAERGTCSYDDCALTVLATVVSRPTPERYHRCVSKALTSDLRLSGTARCKLGPASIRQRDTAISVSPPSPTSRRSAIGAGD